ncbi:MAG: acetoacetate decarboxylase family protein [Rhodoferax sp.]|uniref:acetoacetate decarboxylase family protein n=1 Tax=Rhodoferax sp. TaxID=50421 RepID=UPI002732C3A4|nr:acetoacetate decarboxylase family protein [Rhodoferax sp.]MDP2679088.1 acetoacetate decarboxylase family protein [Rhodoferax sp.]
MSFTFKPNVRYRMPVVFGPAPGPRQKHDGTPWQAEESGTANVQWATIGYRTDKDKLEALLPPGFRLNGEPMVYVTLAYFRDLYWLAGRGYGLVNAEVPVIYTGKSETIEGGLCLAIWEGRPDAITTGREELGFPKLFADIPDVRLKPDSGSISGEASWFDFKFFEMEMHGIEETPVDNMRLLGASGGPIFYKYMPRTGPFGSGGAEAAYVTTSHPLPGASSGTSTMNFGDVAFRKWKAKGGTVKWHRATFEQLPTTCHVVNGIADLDILEVVSAEMIEFSGPGSTVATNGHRVVEPA